MAATLRALSVVANPSDRPRFVASVIYDAAQQAANLQGDRVTWQRVEKATQSALEDALVKGSWNVFHFAGHAECRVALNYTRITLESSAGRARELDGAAFAQVLGARGMPETVVLQACNEDSFCFDLLAEELIKGGARAVVQLCALSGEATRAVLAALYETLLAERPLSSLGPDLRAAHLETAGVKVSFRGEKPMVQRAASTAAQAMQAMHAALAHEEVRRPIGDARPVSQETDAQMDLRRKMQHGDFDVFLCHNSSDKAAVTSIGERLKAAGVLPWLDEWELRPGTEWQVALEQWIVVVRSAAVFIGTGGLGSWQRQELNALMDEGVSRRVPIIPVVLPNVVGEPEIPIFLKQKTWIDFRRPHPDPFMQLLWGITNQRPRE